MDGDGLSIVDKFPDNTTEFAVGGILPTQVDHVVWVNEGVTDRVNISLPGLKAALVT